MLTIGSQGPYEWLVTDDDFVLLQLCPEVVRGKYIAISSIDSGEFVPTHKDVARGWESRRRIAYSPKIQDVEDVPHDGWDEWYIFDNPTDLGISHLAENIFDVPQQPGHLSVFVNYGFALHPPERREGLVDLFWQQLARIGPESQVADNDYMTFVTMNKSLFVKVHDVVKTLSRPD